MNLPQEAEAKSMNQKNGDPNILEVKDRRLIQILFKIWELKQLLHLQLKKNLLKG